MFHDRDLASRNKTFLEARGQSIRLPGVLHEVNAKAVEGADSKSSGRNGIDIFRSPRLAGEHR